ncbi:class F sortase [Microlunatus panaciterrae]|uniref:Sortase (Surface protein transpeptidase) n=1 Tax=Microlunatus panaciterrae TaxID=400768 RepID=A0ABS2RNF6_9ACTN|nr:sortase (surface protein transpeptidase) [Microlunatus panaciterrae]
MLRPSPVDRSRLIRACIALGLAIVGVLLIWGAVGRQSPAEPALAASADRQGAPSATSTRPKPPVERASTHRDQPDVRDRITGPVLPESDPVSVAIPRLGVRTTLVRLGLDARGELEVPHDPAQPGWFIGGAAPGALGPAIIAGHVTWNRAPAVFYRLGSLRRGDHVSVRRSDGKTAVFTVVRVSRFAKARFPTKAVYGPIDHAGLRLITCGGTYDSSRHRYLDNVVVFARLSTVR